MKHYALHHYRNAAIIIVALLAAIGLLRCSSAQADEGWSTIEVYSQPAGAAIFVNGQHYGYAPMSFRVKTYDGELLHPVYLTAVPTLPGEFEQSIWIGPMFNKSNTTVPGGIQFFMYQRPL